MANIKSTDWIVDSAVIAANRFQPRFSYVYLPHLDYAAQKSGPNSPQALQAVADLEKAIARLVQGFASARLKDIHWLFASEYVIQDVSAVSYPNRALRQAGLLQLREENGREYLVPGESEAWALVDHQLAHVFVSDPTRVGSVADLFRHHPLIKHVLIGTDRGRFNLDHPRSGDVVLISDPDAWFAYYWWEDDSRAPEFAQTVDIHRKPGYDPVELFIEMPAKKIPLDATLVRGSHGYPADDPSRCGVLVSSHPLAESRYRDIDVAPLILEKFGVTF
jgi:predicted AlkP superfamily pyrophosphatase or phosphodiesterase